MALQAMLRSRSHPFLAGSVVTPFQPDPQSPLFSRIRSHPIFAGSVVTPFLAGSVVTPFQPDPQSPFFSQIRSHPFLAGSVVSPFQPDLSPKQLLQTFLWVNEKLSTHEFIICDTRHNATNVISDKRNKTTNIITNKPHNATHVIQVYRLRRLSKCHLVYSTKRIWPQYCQKKRKEKTLLKV